MPRKSLGWKVCPFLLRQRDMSSGTLTVIAIIFSLSAVLSESLVTIAVLLWALLGHGSFTPRQGVSQAARQGRSWSTSNRSLSLVKLRWKSIVKVCFSFFPPSLYIYLFFSTSFSSPLTLFFLSISYIFAVSTQHTDTAQVGGLLRRWIQMKNYFFLDSRHSSWGVGQLIIIYFHRLQQYRLIFLLNLGKRLTWTCWGLYQDKLRYWYLLD